MERPSGEADPFDYQSFESKFEVPSRKFARMTLQELFTLIEKSGEDMAGQMERLAFRRISESSEKAGTAIDFGGRKFDCDVFIESLTPLQIDFDGVLERPMMPTMVVGPEMGKVLVERLPTMEADPVCQEKFRKLMLSKYEEWRARQDRKQLVD